MVVDGRRSMSRRYDSGETKKGPWKAEEDEVLINHVRKYGPRDWSSIRSKGLLQRTGKSCRLRWVNKLRPNLKSGVKFTAEEERVVIELQAQFGNKWAKIATYLSGRTDNDVKNFWSSRQKRLARILQNSSPSSSKFPKNTKDIKPTTMTMRSFHTAGGSLQSDEGLRFCSSVEDEMVKSQSCSSLHISHPETLKLVPLPELVYPNMLTYENFPFQFDYVSSDTKPFIEPQSHISFPASFPHLQPDFPFPLESQEFVTRVGDPNFVDIFGYTSEPPFVPAQHPVANPSFLGPKTSPQIAGDEENHIEDASAVAPDIFFDDFPPMDMFDQIETLPSPSDWS